MTTQATDAKEVFGNALLMASAEERSAYLDQTCADNPGLRAEVDELLVAVQAAGSFLEHPQFSATEAIGSIASISERPGDRIGNYKLLERIGEGGFGTVFMAEQLAPVKRKVAVKILKLGMDTKEVLARFEAERQALAMMDHLHIARILDGGTTEAGRPYFAMELVRGIPITEYCDEARLADRERLKLFVDVCLAVQHAHQKGIIHRDLKPSNVLVTMYDDKAIVKVIDFGIAKALGQPLTDRTLFTGHHQMLGTPQYMSPEQAQMSGIDVDTRSDVYSLGVLLYELLTGTTPFDKESLSKMGLDEWRRMIREQEPLRPSARISTVDARARSTIADRRRIDLRRVSENLRGELDWIVMKALEKDRNRRYESPSLFAMDVERYLNDEAVQARPPSTRYRFSKFARRNRGTLIATSLIVVAMIFGATVSIWQAIQAAQAEQRAKAGGALARQAVDEMYTEVAEKWLADEGGLNDMQHQFLEKAMRFYVEFAADHPDDLTFRIERLRAMERVGAIQARLGKHTEAEVTNQQLIAESAKLLSAHPNSPDFTLALAAARLQLGELLGKLGRSNEGSEFYAQAFLDSKALIDVKIDDHTMLQRIAGLLQGLTRKLTETGRKQQAEECILACIALWQSLVTEQPGSLEYRFGLADAVRIQGAQCMWWGDRTEEAEVAFLDAEKRLVALLDEQPQSRKCRHALAGTYQSLGVLRSWKNRNEESLIYDRKGLAIAESLARDYPMDQSALIKLRDLLGNTAASLAALQNGDTTERVTLLRRKLEVQERLCNQYPDVIDFQRRYALSASWQLIALYQESKDKEAKLFSDDCLRWIDGLLPPTEWNHDTFEMLVSLNLLRCYSALVQLETGDYLKAAAILESLPAKTRCFNEDMVVRDGHDGWKLTAQYLIGCNAQLLVLRRPSVILGQCALKAEQDETLEGEHGSEIARKFRERAAEFENEFNNASAAWAERLRLGSLDQEQLKAVFGALYEDSFDRTPFEIENDLVRGVQLSLCHQLLEAFSQLPNASDSLFVGYLTAGPDEIQDAEIALRLARNGMTVDPNGGMSKQDLAWALFRSGSYQECYDILQSTEIGGAECSAIMAMTLWQLGRREEAATWVDQRYDQSLAEYLERRKTDQAKGQITWPTSDMLLRLDREAKDMLGKSHTESSK